MNELHPDIVPPTSPAVEATGPHQDAPKLRRGLETLFGVVWNVPIVVSFFLFAFRVIDDDTMFTIWAAWPLIVPISALLVAHNDFVQRLIFEPGGDMKRQRPTLWCIAVFWTVLPLLYFAFLRRPPEKPAPEDATDRLLMQILKDTDLLFPTPDADLSPEE